MHVYAWRERERETRIRKEEGEKFSSRLSGNTNFIAQQDLCGCALPAPTATGRNHKRARGVEIELRNDACAMAGDNEKRGCSRTGFGAGILVREIVESKDVV